MPDCMTFPDTVEEFMEQYKVVDTEQVYTNGTEFVPIYRMRQWFQHEPETHENRTETHGVCLDAIDRQATLDWLKNEWNGRIATLFDGIKAFPSAKPEIIRCKDCKHQVKEWRADKRLKDKGYMVCGCEVVGDACGYWALLGRDDDYCSMAERRTDE